MKFLSILAMVFSFTQCGSIQLENKPPFAITNATYYTWAGGQAGVRGINVTITLQKQTDVVFDSLYFRNKITKVETKDALVVANYSLSKKIPTDIILDVDPKKEINNAPPKTKKFPFTLEKNEAIVSYLENGKTKYYKIKNVIKKEDNSLKRVQ